jgi:hypothetical protein
MKSFAGVLLLLVGISSGLADEKKKSVPPACQDEEAMVADYEKGIAELISTVQKESLADFSRAYHRKSCLTKLTLATGILDTAAACFDQAVQDPATPKAQAEGYRAKRDAYAKLKDKLGHYRDSVKAAEEDRAAKALIEKFDLAR